MLDYKSSSEYLQSEEPAIKLLWELGYDFFEGETLDRPLSSVILEDDLVKSIKNLNEWISEDNIKTVIKQITTPKNTDLMLINQEMAMNFIKGIPVQQDIWMGKKNQTVRIFDFENPENNTYKVVNQFRVKMKENIGIYEKDIPDLVVFVNGIPLSIIECKAPTVENALKKGIDQLARYQREIPKLFWYANMLVSCAGSSGLLYGTVGTPASYYAFWKTNYPYENTDEVKKNIKTIKSPTPQDITLFSMFDRGNFLDILQNFTVFENENQKLIKKVCRRQQFQAVRKMTERLLDRKENGGIVWHTQGSWKSLTMVYSALKVKRIKELENPTIVIVTDRNNLDNQISWTFQNVGFENPIQIKASGLSKTKNLMKELKNSEGKTILTTIQSFQSDDDYPLLDDRKNIIVFVDEAHRTQFGLWITMSWKMGYAGNMRKWLPNAFFVAFTGTPIEKEGLQNVKKVFGSYIDMYKLSDAVADGATVSVKYELRYAIQSLDKENFDKGYSFIMWWLDKEEQDEIKKKYWTTQDIVETPERIKAVAMDIIQHYREKIEPNWYKAMIVASSRHACILYKKYLDEFNAPDSVVIISWSNNDTEDLKKCHLTKEQEDAIVGKNWTYHEPNNPLKILIVNEKLLTGFDAPICQVMYLDSLLKEHTLLQAIARTNRNCTIEKGDQKFKKTYGLVVDYAGIGSYLTQALEMFDNAEMSQDDVLFSQSKDLGILDERLEQIKGFFKENWIKEQSDLEDYLAVLEEESLRAKFKEYWKSFNETLDELLPNNEIIETYGKDIKQLAVLTNAMRERFRELKNQYLIEEMGAKVKKLIDDYVRSFGVKVVVSEVDILDIDFKNRIKNFGSDKGQASEFRNQLKNIISTKVGVENPTLAEKLSEKLNRIIHEVHEGIMDIKKELEEYQIIRDEMLSAYEEQKNKKMNNLTYAIFTYLKEQGINQDEASKDITDWLKPLCVVDWISKIDAIKDIKVYLKKKLYTLGFENEEKRWESINEILEIMKLQYAN